MSPGPSPKEIKALKKETPPGFLLEVTWITVSLFLVKLSVPDAFHALTFVTILLPLMLYFIVSVLQDLLGFIGSLHMEDYSEEHSILSPRQFELLFNVFINMLGYFGLYSISGELDRLLAQKEGINTDWKPLLPAIVALELAFLIQLVKNYRKRAAIAKALGKESASGFFGATGLTTLFNALTQTTTTLCANGQCFTIYSNTISSNMAAFGVSVTGVNTYLIPICCCLLTYSIWSVYKTKRDLCYKPFLMVTVGAVLIILDNFVMGDIWNLHNVPSWTGNVLLIGGVIWSSRDSAKDQSPFGF